jgi:hypothetical protein
LSAFGQNAESFEWYKDGALIDGETSNSLTITQSGKYRVVGINEFGKGLESAVKEVLILGCTTIVEGDDQNRCPDETITLAASSHGASMFEWRKDGAVIEGQTSGTLTVHESGSYTAAAVHGGVVSTPSEPKVVTINECLFVDVIVGQWQVEERKVYFNDMINNRHTVTFEKVDNTTVKISNFTGEGIPDQVIEASVDNEARSITIGYQPIITTDTFSGYITYLSAVVSQATPENINVGIGTIMVEGRGKGEMRFVFPSTIKSTGKDGVERNHTWYALAFTGDPDDGGVLLGVNQMGYDTVWTKR